MKAPYKPSRKTTLSEKVVRLHASSFWDKDFSKSKKVAVMHVPTVRYNPTKYAKKKPRMSTKNTGRMHKTSTLRDDFNLMNYHRRYTEDAIIDSILKAYHSGKYGLGETSTFKLQHVVIK